MHSLNTFLQAGRVAALDALASRIYSAIPTSRQQIFDEAISLSESLGSAAEYYLRVMKKVVNGTEDFVAKETKRYVINTIAVVSP